MGSQSLMLSLASLKRKGGKISSSLCGLVTEEKSGGRICNRNRWFSLPIADLTYHKPQKSMRVRLGFFKSIEYSLEIQLEK